MQGCVRLRNAVNCIEMHFGDYYYSEVGPLTSGAADTTVVAQTLSCRAQACPEFTANPAQTADQSMLFCNTYNNMAYAMHCQTGYVSQIQSRTGTVCINQTFALVMKLRPEIGWLMLQSAVHQTAWLGNCAASLGHQKRSGLDYCSCWQSRHLQTNP